MNIEIIKRIFFCHELLRLETIHKKEKKYSQNTKTNMLQNNTWVTEEIKRRIRNYMENSKNEETNCQTLWDAVKTV